MNVTEAINDFLLASEADGLKKATLAWYRSLLKQYAEQHGERAIKQVTPTDVRKYIVGIRDSGYSEHTQHDVIRALHRFWAWVSVEYECKNPMQNVKRPPQPEPVPGKNAHLQDAARLLAYLSGDDIQSIRDRAIVAMLIATGARAGGIVGLERDHVDIGARRATVTEKGGKSRVVFFDTDTQHDLRRWYETRRYGVKWLFYNLRSGKQLTASGLLQIMYRLGGEAGCTGRVNPHAWRHMFGVEARKLRMDSINLSDLMGHEDVQTTSDYYAAFGSIEQLQEVYDQYAPRLRIKMSSD